MTFDDVLDKPIDRLSHSNFNFANAARNNTILVTRTSIFIVDFMADFIERSGLLQCCQNRNANCIVAIKWCLILVNL